MTTTAANLVMPMLPEWGYNTAAAQRQAQQQMRVQSQFSDTSTEQSSPLSSSGSTVSQPPSPKASARKPAFLPAVLRPNEFPSRNCRVERSPHSPPAAPVSTPVDGPGERRHSASLMNMSLIARMAGRPAPAVAGGDDGAAWDLEGFPDVSGPPTRSHWKPDHSSTMCDDPVCLRTFSYFTRRHHCRRCGHIFCDAHSAFAVPLDADANFNPRGARVRSCAHCHAQYREWKSRNNSRESSAASSVAATPIVPATAPLPLNDHMSPTSPMPAAWRRGFAQPTMPPVTPASAPREWSWSTF